MAVVDTEGAYIMGQILALLGHAGVLPGPERQMQRAYLSPVSVIQPAIVRLKQDPTKSRVIDARLTELMSQLGELPHRPLNNEESGTFSLGYYHERARLRGGRPPKEQSEAELTARWEILLPPDLKTWALEHGGAGLVRQLLERERNLEI